jgi:hypothetical protein
LVGWTINNCLDHYMAFPGGSSEFPVKAL